MDCLSLQSLFVDDLIHICSFLHLSDLIEVFFVDKFFKDFVYTYCFKRLSILFKSVENGENLKPPIPMLLFIKLILFSKFIVAQNYNTFMRCLVAHTSTPVSHVKTDECVLIYLCSLCLDRPGIDYHQNRIDRYYMCIKHKSCVVNEFSSHMDKNELISHFVRVRYALLNGHHCNYVRENESQLNAKVSVRLCQCCLESRRDATL